MALVVRRLARAAPAAARAPALTHGGSRARRSRRGSWTACTTRRARQEGSSSVSWSAPAGHATSASRCIARGSPLHRLADQVTMHGQIYAPSGAVLRESAVFSRAGRAAEVLGVHAPGPGVLGICFDNAASGVAAKVVEVSVVEEGRSAPGTLSRTASLTRRRGHGPHPCAHPAPADEASMASLSAAMRPLERAVHELAGHLRAIHLASDRQTRCACTRQRGTGAGAYSTGWADTQGRVRSTRSRPRYWRQGGSAHHNGDGDRGRPSGGPGAGSEARARKPRCSGGSWRIRVRQPGCYCSSCVWWERGSGRLREADP